MSIANAGSVRYLGGYANEFASTSGRLWFTDALVGIGDQAPERVLVDTDRVIAVEITTAEIAKSKVPAAVAFGVLGALAARGSEKKTMVIVYLRSGDAGYFQVESLEMPFVIGLISEWLQEHGIRAGSPGAAAASNGLGDQLERVAALHRAGDLTDDEFTAAKARLLNN